MLHALATNFMHLTCINYIVETLVLMLLLLSKRKFGAKGTCRSESATGDPSPPLSISGIGIAEKGNKNFCQLLRYIVESYLHVATPARRMLV